MIGNLYIITNNINNKVYIGKTYQDIEKRFKEHKKDSTKERNKDRPLYKAFNKYGIENFSIEFLGSYEEGLLEEKEIEFIRKYNSYIKDNGYNATLGGDGSRYLTFTEEEVIDKYEELKYAKSVAEYYECSPKTILNILHKNNIKIKKNNNYPRRIKVLQYDLNMEIINKFKSMADAARWLILNNHTGDTSLSSISTKISLCCKDKKKSAYGFIWKYDKD